MAAIIENPVSRPVGLQHRLFPALAVIGIALMLAVTAVLIVAAVAHGSSPVGYQTGTPVVVPHPVPGPPGS